MNYKFAKLTVIAYHASTEDAKEEIKGESDEQLDKEIRTTHQQKVLMVVGDLNARVREDNTGR